MTKELEQAADEWVEKYAFRVPYDGSNEFYDKEADKHGRAGFIAGATSPAAKAYHEAQGWVSVEERLPEPLDAVWMTNGNGWVALGCMVQVEGGWHWAISNGIIYSENGKIVSECESDDLDVKFWHPTPALPLPPKTDKQ